MSVLKRICLEYPNGVDEETAVDAVAAELGCPKGRKKSVAKQTIEQLIERKNLKKDEEGRINLS